MEKKKLPDGWKWSTLGKECIINPRKSKDLQAEDDQETSFVPMEAVDGDLGRICEIITVPFQKVKKGYTYFEEDDVLFAKITPCMQNKKSAIARNLITKFGFGSTEFHVFRCKEQVIPEWIYYFIRNQRFLEEAKTHFTGAVGQQRVPTSFLEDYPILVPPVSIQQEIAAKLDRQMIELQTMKNDITAQEVRIKLLFESYLGLVFQYLNESTIEMKINQFCEKPQYGYTAPSNKEEIGPKLLRITDIQNNEVDWNSVPYCNCPSDKYNQYKLENNDIVFARTGATTGKSFLVKNPVNCIFASYLIRLKVKKQKVLPEYLYLFFKSPGYWNQIYKYSRGGTLPNFNATMLGNLKIPVPSLEMQQQIVQKSNEIYTLYKHLLYTNSIQLNAVNQLPSSILNEVFGKYESPERYE